IYQKVLTMCNAEPALREGSFFDLMYVNLQHEGFNPHYHFAFLRYTSDSVLLIAVNFDNACSEMDIIIPQLAFDMAGIPEGSVEAEDLLCGRNTILELHPDKATHVKLKPKDAVVYRIK
ncbi:MAG: alpha-amylase, partial [Muribaculaceae bacterium]|nr:alpha-amylase [Muribaculaceae bacterium]